jgi:hypothetical protein
MNIFASIPPFIRGESLVASGENGFQRGVLRSWVASGLTPVSFNTQSEYDANPEFAKFLLGQGMQAIPVPSTVGAFPSHLPNLVKSLQAIASLHPKGPILLTNADIHIALSSTAKDRLGGLADRRFLLAHRAEVNESQRLLIGHRDFRGDKLAVWPSGIDFFAFGPELLRSALGFLSNSLTIGLPWWDMMLPMALLAAGGEPHYLDSTDFLHVSHTERWDGKWWSTIGAEATRHLSRSIDRRMAPLPVRQWAQGYASAVSPIQPPRIFMKRLRMYGSNLRTGRHRSVVLAEVAGMTEAIVCDAGR